MTHTDLIKRLSRVDEYDPVGHDAWEAADALSDLRAENQRLREALREIINHCANSGRGNALVNDRIYERCEETARAVLRSTREVSK